MKSYFLAPVGSRSAAIAALCSILPGQNDTWLLKDGTGDAIAYLSLVEPDSATAERTIQADVSGRHYNEDSAVISILEKLRTELGGKITNDA